MMFDRIAHRYDLLNRLLSLGRDVAWRKRVSSFLPGRHNMSVLDLATGTADLLISVYENSGRVALGVGVDMAGKMLALAHKKITQRKLEEALTAVRGNVNSLPFADGSFDAVTIAFGIRNLEDVSAGLNEMHRVLNAGGKALILEFSLPANWFVRWLYLVYFRYILPLIGAVISGDSYAYRYLNRTVEKFPYGKEFCRLMEHAGFQDVHVHPLTFGIATIYEGTRPLTVDSTISSPGSVSPGVNEVIEKMSERIQRTLPGTRRDGVVRISMKIPACDPLEWLNGQMSDDRVYWLDREGKFEAAGVGVADRFDTTREPTLASALTSINAICSGSDDGVRYYGGCRFNSAGPVDREWEEFGDYRFHLPRWEMIRTGNGTCFACNLVPDRDADKREIILDELQTLRFDSPVSAPETPSVASREHIPSIAQWQSAVDAALDAIESDKYQKIVLARKTSLTLDEPITPLAIVRGLGDRSSGCYRFCFQPHVTGAFVGATPERLYLRHKRDLYCEAVAGTRPRGIDPDEDTMLSHQLSDSAKEISEHRLVVRSIKESLVNLVESGPDEQGAPESLLKLDRVQHLITRLKASLRDNIGDADVLAAMHPTAAVGGYPARAVVGEIRRLEGFDRGWYAGPVGWVSRDESEFAVAIRSALLYRNSVNAYAGAGIVTGSRADAEWAEMDSKISGFMELLS